MARKRPIENEEPEKESRVAKSSITPPTPTLFDANSDSNSDSPLPSPSVYIIKPISPKSKQRKPPTTKKKKKTKERSEIINKDNDPVAVIASLTLGLPSLSSAREVNKLSKNKQNRVSKDSVIEAEEVALNGKVNGEDNDDDEVLMVAEEENENAEEEEAEKWWEKYPFLRESLEMESYLSDGAKEMLKQKFGVIGDMKLKEFEKRWKMLRNAELKLFVQKTELLQQQFNLVLDAIDPREFLGTPNSRF